MTETLTVPFATIAVMAGVGVFSLIVPVVLGVVLKIRVKARWRFFLLGAATFFLFANLLEGGLHTLILGSAAGGVIQGNIWLYALYGGAMAGIFEETGRLAALRVTRKALRGPEDGLMYGAGHGGIEMMLVAGVTMLNQVFIAVTLNQGGLAAVEQMMGSVPEQGMAILQTMATSPSGLYLWAAFERLSALLLHVALSVLVYAAVTRKGKGWCFPAAVGLHTLVDVAAVASNALFPIWATELLVLALAVGTALLARNIYRGLEVRETSEEILPESP